MDDTDGSPCGPTHTLLHTSIMKQDFATVQQLISLSANCINACCPCGVSHFASAVAGGNARIVNFLISNKANVNAYGKTESSDVKASPIHIACATTSYDIANALVQNGADVNARCTLDASTPMHVNACFNVMLDKSMRDGKSLIDESQIIQTLLLSARADINAQNADGQTPLHVAIRHGVTTMQCFLIRNGADLNVFDKQQRNAIIYAVSHGSSSTTALLLANRCPVPQYHIPLVCRAASRNGWSILIQLLNNGANVNDTDELGNNAIHYSLKAVNGSDNCCRETHIIEKLISRGCNPCHTNNAGFTPLHMVMAPSPTYKPSHAEYILLEHTINSRYRHVYGAPPDTAKEMAARMNTSWLYKHVELIFKITSGTPAYRTTPPFDLLTDLHKIADGLISDKNAKEMLAHEPPCKNAKQRRNERKADELRLRIAKASFLQALLRRSLTPSFAPSSTKECIVCLEPCNPATMPVLAPCGHRSVCVDCLPLIKAVCPSCRECVLSVARKIYD